MQVGGISSIDYRYPMSSICENGKRSFTKFLLAILQIKKEEKK